MAGPADYGMVPVNGGENWTNAPGTGLDASGNLLPGYKYATYSNGIGQGTPVQIGGLGLGGQTVTANEPPAAGTYNPNITVGPQQQAAPSTANMAVNNPANTYVSPFDGMRYENTVFHRDSMGMPVTGGPAHEISGWSGPALESQGFLSQLMQMMQQMQGGGQAQQAYSPQQQYNPYGQQGYNPFGSMYGNYNPFGSQYSSYTQPMQSTGGAAAPGQMVTQSYTPSNNVSNSATQGGQAGSFSPGYMPYDMGFRQGNMPNFGPLSQLQANVMYA